MKINKKYIIILIALSIFSLISLYLYKKYNSPKVVYYAQLKRISTSGDARFYWYDTELKETIFDNQYDWFWAMPKNVPDDLTLTNKWVGYLKNNSDSVFKITGSKGKADCDYWGKDHCVEDINVEAIEVLNSGNPMIFNNKQKDEQELTMSKSVCDEILKETTLEPVILFKGKPAKVNFLKYPELNLHRTIISEQVAEGSNFAGHFTFVSWGCGTSCFSYTIIDSISGDSIFDSERTVQGVNPSFGLDSRLLTFNSKDDFQKWNGIKLSEIEGTNIFLFKNGREYYELVEENKESAWLYKLCTENVLDGIYAY